MPDLLHTLINYDPEMLCIIAGKWGLALASESHNETINEIVIHLTDPVLFEVFFRQIPDDQKNCLEVLARESGKMPWSTFTRKYGTIREMGIARRERETPYDTPISIAESLWYSGLIGRAFLNLKDGLQEYAYIPNEFMSFVPPKNGTTDSIPVSVATRNEYRIIYAADDHILDHMTSYLAAIRSGRDMEDLKKEFKQPTIQEGRALLFCNDLIDHKGAIKSEAVKDFLARPRTEALLSICTNWLESTSFNELKLMPGIINDGAWRNDPLKTRQVLIEQLRLLSDDQWWSIKSFIFHIKSTQPDYQRPAGDYESWSIRSNTTGSSLHGFQHWDEVDGALINYLIVGPLHWLGFVDLGCSRRGAFPESFRFSKFADSLFSKQAPRTVHEENGMLTVLRNGQVTCPKNTARSMRYQLARFCDWRGVNDKGYLYEITPGSLKNADRQGLLIEQLLKLLSRHASGGLPASLVASLQRWAKSGVQVYMKKLVILQTTSPEVMIGIKKSPVGRFLGEVLNPTMVKVSQAGAKKIMQYLLESGYFCEAEDGVLSVDTHKD
jgi:hypothetical protein